LRSLFFIDTSSDVGWPYRRRQWLNGFEYRVMRPVAVDAKQVLFFSVPHAGPLSMESHFPIAKNRPMALGTEVIRLLETHNFAICKPQCVPVVRIVAVKTPSVRHVIQQNFLVHLFKFPWFSVHRHSLMALGAWENAGGEGRRGNKELLGNLLFRRFRRSGAEQETKEQQDGDWKSGPFHCSHGASYP